MNTKSKVIIVLCSVFAVLFLVLYIVLGFFKPVIVDELVYPASGLSQSVFDSQNMVYVQTDGYVNKHYFRKVPYTIDTASGARAGIGDGAFYESEPYYFYYSELGIKEDMVSVLKEEMTDILSITANEADTVVEILKEEQGYINGCVATFYVLRVAAGQVTSHMCLYRMHINDDNYKSDWDLLVGVMDKYATATTESLNNLFTLANASVHTMAYSKEIEEALIRQAEEAMEKAEEKTESESEAEPVSTAVPEETPAPTVDPNNDLFKTP